MTEKQLNDLLALNKEYLETSEVLFEIYNNNLTKHLKNAVLAETKTENAKNEIFARLNTTNILTKITNKLAKSYNTIVLRKFIDSNEIVRSKVQESIDLLEEAYDIDYVMSLADILLNLNGTVLIEVLQDKINIIPAYKFIFNNNILVVFEEDYIKVVEGVVVQYFDLNKKYIKEEILEFNPYIVANKSLFLAQPYPDYDTINMVLLLPLMLTDLNFALRFQSHSIIYGINIEANELALTPNSFWSFKSNDDNKPEIGTINPTVDADKLLNSVKDQFLLWLDTKNIKINSIDGSSLSGVAKAIDNASVDEQIKENQKIWKRIENLIWQLINNYHNIDYKYLPSILFIDNTKPLETNKERIENLLLLLNNKLKTKRQVLQELYSEYTNEEIDNLLAELEKNSETAKFETNSLSNTNTSKNKIEVKNEQV